MGDTRTGASRLLGVIHRREPYGRETEKLGSADVFVLSVYPIHPHCEPPL